jgi:phosphoenolpyruvate---glycerone phosphotransferase subunit DhaL
VTKETLMGNPHEALTPRLIDAMVRTVVTEAELLGELDRAIGDGDHGLNMKRGFLAIAEKRDELAGLPLAAALEAMGKVLVMTVGGASGPLYGSLLIAMGRAAATNQGLGTMIDDGIAAVKKRGKSEQGAKTMLDVLIPVQLAWRQAGSEGLALPETLARLRQAARAGLEATQPLMATKGRAAFLRERSIGHLDPGACSCCLLVNAACDTFEEPKSP